MMRIKSLPVRLLALAAAAIGVLVLLGSSCGPANKAPNVPGIAGPGSGGTGITYMYTAAAADPDDDSVGIRIDWGDGDTSVWNAFLPGGDSVTMAHAWTSPGVYGVRSQSRDVSGLLSAWSSPFVVNIMDLSIRTFGGASNDFGYSIAQTRDSGFIVSGCTHSYGAGQADVWLLRTDAAGNRLWDRVFGNANWEEGYSVIQTRDGGFAIAGRAGSFVDGWLIRTDDAGNKLWDKTFGEHDVDLFSSVVQTGDGGFLLTGSTLNTSGGYNVWLVRTDAAGSLLWDKNFGGPDEDYGYSGVQTSDGGFIVAGCTKSYGSGREDMWLVRTDSAGNKLWDKTFGGTNVDWANSVVLTEDGGFAVVGITYDDGAGGSGILLVRTDSMGNQLWAKTFAGTLMDIGGAVVRTSDGGFAVAGMDVGGASVLLIRTDPAGNQLWDRTYGGSGTDQGYSVVQTSDRGFVVVGRTGSFGAGGYDVMFIRTDFQGEISP
jgi:hypothetical protein